MPSSGKAPPRGKHDADDELVQLAGVQADIGELRRLADTDNTDAADVLAEMLDEAGVD